MDKNSRDFVDAFVEWMGETVVHTLGATGHEVTGDKVAEVMYELRARTRGNRGPDSIMTKADFAMLVEATVAWSARQFGRTVE